MAGSTTIDSLPFEILDLILSQAAELNIKEAVTYTYGLTEAPQPLQHVTLERYVRGRKPEDSLRWVAVDAIRQVSSTWRQWALGHAVKELYIRRWRGSERWIESRQLSSLHSQPSGQAVYRQPYNAVKESAKCVSKCSDLASHVRRLWFDGLYTAETNADIFKILAQCHNLQSLTMPWIALRYGSADFWRMLLREGQLTSLELTAIDLMKSQLGSPRNQVDHKPLMDPNLSFRGLSKLKIFGNTNFKPVTDHDLRMMARTATELKAVHVTGISSVSISGIMSLVKASSSTLRVLEYSPLSADGFDHPDPDRDGHGTSFHCCPVLLSCPRLTDLSTSVPTICPDLFRDESVRWSGDLQIRAARICGENDGKPLQTPEATAVFKEVLESARRLINVRREAGKELDVEIFISSYIFTPSNSLVHGNFEVAQALSEFTWPSSPHSYSAPSSSSGSTSSLYDYPTALAPSSKGPYGQTGLYGKDLGPYSCISEEAFFEGVSDGWVNF